MWLLMVHLTPINVLSQNPLFLILSLIVQCHCHLVECIKEAFHHIGIVDITTHLHGLNVNGASVNLGIHRGVAALLKNECPWLTAIHCFNRRIELAAKDAFGNSDFEDIEQMLAFLYKLYQNSSKRLKALRCCNRRKSAETCEGIRYSMDWASL